MKSAGRTALLLAASLVVACVADQYSNAQRAAEQYERCVAAQGEDDAECQALGERKREAQRRYEGDAQRAWGCDPSQDACPTPR